jgi:hypothetical protein
MPVSKTYTCFFDGHLDHPDTQRLAAALEVLGLPRRWRDWAGTVAPLLNLYCLQHQEDGDLTHLPAERIAQICRWPIPSKSEEFVGALKCAGVLEEQEQAGGGVRYVVHNFRHYCRRVLNERDRKRALRGHGRGQDAHHETTPPQTVRGVSTDVSADKVAPIGIVIGTGNGSVKDRERFLSEVPSTESPAPAKTTTTDTAGAARPILEKQAGTGNGNGTKPTGGGASEQRSAQAGSPQAETAGASHRAELGTAGRTTKTETTKPEQGIAGVALADTPSASTASPRLTTENPAPDWDPPRPADVQAQVSMFAELLRRWGWDEKQVRRVLAWLTSYKRGEWLRRSCEGDFWRVLAFAKQIEIWRAGGGEVRDAVSMLIAMIEKGYTPKEENYRLAKTAWIHLDGEGERIEPIWMREILDGVGRACVPVVAGVAR